MSAGAESSDEGAQIVLEHGLVAGGQAAPGPVQTGQSPSSGLVDPASTYDGPPRGLYPEVRIRGSDNAQVLILLDGIELGRVGDAP